MPRRRTQLNLGFNLQTLGFAFFIAFMLFMLIYDHISDERSFRHLQELDQFISALCRENPDFKNVSITSSRHLRVYGTLRTQAEIDVIKTYVISHFGYDAAYADTVIQVKLKPATATSPVS